MISRALRILPLAALSLSLSVGCAAAQLKGPKLVQVPPKRGATVVVIEPLFEQAQTVINEKAQTAQVSPIGGGYYGGYGQQTVTVVQKVAEKPLLARVPVLTDLQAKVMQKVKTARPDWEVASTAVLKGQSSGDVVLVRTIVRDTVTVGSNRSFRNLSFGFGLVIWPLLYFAAQPVEETQRVYGTLYRYETDASAFKGRLIRYPTQPDFAVDTRGIPFREQPYGLDIEYEEGLFANDLARDPVMIEGFSDQLANAIIALVEGV